MLQNKRHRQELLGQIWNSQVIPAGDQPCYPFRDGHRCGQQKGWNVDPYLEYQRLIFRTHFQKII